MEAEDLAVLRRAREWLAEGHSVVLYTVIETWSCTPRPVGSMMALREDGEVEGSVSAGCIEDDLLARIPLEDSDECGVVSYGVTPLQASRCGLSGEGRLRLLREPLRKVGWIDELLRRCAHQEPVVRRLDLASGRVELETGHGDETLQFDGNTLRAPFVVDAVARG